MYITQHRIYISFHKKSGLHIYLSQSSGNYQIINALSTFAFYWNESDAEKNIFTSAIPLNFRTKAKEGNQNGRVKPRLSCPLFGQCGQKHEAP